MTLYHVSPSRNDASIARHGLDPRKSRTAARECWLCTITQVGWAVAHVSKRHHVPAQDCTIWLVDVDRSELRRRLRRRWSSDGRRCLHAHHPVSVAEITYPDDLQVRRGRP